MDHPHQQPRPMRMDPTATLDRGQHRTNTYHHPETLLADIKSGFTDDTADINRDQKTDGDNREQHHTDTGADTGTVHVNGHGEKPAIPPELLDQGQQRTAPYHQAEVPPVNTRDTTSSTTTRDANRHNGNGDRNSAENRNGPSKNAAGDDDEPR